MFCKAATFCLSKSNSLAFITETESVYCAVRTASLNKADYVSSFKGKDTGTLYKIDKSPSTDFLNSCISQKMFLVTESFISGETEKFPELLKKLFKVFVQAWNFSPLRSTPPATGCSDPSTAPNAGNIV